MTALRGHAELYSALAKELRADNIIEFLQLEALGKIRVYDLFDGDDVERYVEEDAPEPVSASTEGTRS